MTRLPHTVYMAALAIAAAILIWWLAQSTAGLVALAMVVAAILIGQKRGIIP